MQAEIERMEHEMRQQKLQNEMLSQNLNRLRSVLASSFASLPLPGTHEPPNIHTIDKYMNEVKAMQEANSVHFAPFLNRVKDIISRLELWLPNDHQEQSSDLTPETSTTVTTTTNTATAPDHMLIWMDKAKNTNGSCCWSEWACGMEKETLVFVLMFVVFSQIVKL